MCRIAVQILNKESLEIGTGGLNMELSKSLPLLEFFRATNQGVKKKTPPKRLRSDLFWRRPMGFPLGWRVEPLFLKPLLISTRLCGVAAATIIYLFSEVRYFGCVFPPTKLDVLSFELGLVLTTMVFFYFELGQNRFATISLVQRDAT